MLSQQPQEWASRLCEPHMYKPQGELATMCATSSTHHVLVSFWEPVFGTFTGTRGCGADVPSGQTTPLLSYSEFSLLWSIITGCPCPNLCDLWMPSYLAKEWMTHYCWQRVFAHKINDLKCGTHTMSKSNVSGESLEIKMNGKMSGDFPRECVFHFYCREGEALCTDLQHSGKNPRWMDEFLFLQLDVDANEARLGL